MAISLIILIGMWFWSLRNEKAKIVFCDVGQGDGILISIKQTQMLIDTGPANKKILKCLERHLPFWDKTIEAAIITHGDSDHGGGLSDVLRSYKISHVFTNDPLKVLIEQNIYSKNLYFSDIVKVGMIEYEVVNPEKNSNNSDDDNERSIAGFLSYKDSKILMLADITKEVERKLVWRNFLNQKAKIVKVAHHGSDTGTSEELLKIVDPEVAIISVGKNNRFGHPSKEVLERLKNFGVKIERTDERGDVVYVFD